MKGPYAIRQFIISTVRCIMETPYTLKVYYSECDKLWNIHILAKIIYVDNIGALKERFKYRYEIDKIDKIDYFFTYKERVIE